MEHGKTGLHTKLVHSLVKQELELNIVELTIMDSLVFHSGCAQLINQKAMKFMIALKQDMELVIPKVLIGDHISTKYSQNDIVSKN